MISAKKKKKDARSHSCIIYELYLAIHAYNSIAGTLCELLLSERYAAGGPLPSVGHTCTRQTTSTSAQYSRIPVIFSHNKLVPIKEFLWATVAVSGFTMFSAVFNVWLQMMSLPWILVSHTPVNSYPLSNWDYPACYLLALQGQDGLHSSRVPRPHLRALGTTLTTCCTLTLFSDTWHTVYSA